MGPPSLAVEVISYTSKRTDRLQKRRLYQEEGVPEYWIVDPEERRVERWRPADQEPEVLTERLTWRPEEVLSGRPEGVLFRLQRLRVYLDWDTLRK